MSFPWIDYLRVAEALIHARTTFAPAEARYRTAISRAYYAAYCAARNHARDYGGYEPVLSGADHRLVIAHYRAGASKSHQAIGRLLDRLLFERHRADYDDNANYGMRSMALLMVNQAQRVFALLQELAS